MAEKPAPPGDGASLAETGRKLHETALASAEVIARRAAIGAEAIAAPSAEATAEAGRMVVEKADALLRASFALTGTGVEAARRTADFVAEEMAAMARAPSLPDLWDRFTAHGVAMRALALRAGADALEPFHAAATDNVERLRNSK